MTKRALLAESRRHHELQKRARAFVDAIPEKRITALMADLTPMERDVVIGGVEGGLRWLMSLEWVRCGSERNRHYIDHEGKPIRRKQPKPAAPPSP